MRNHSNEKEQWGKRKKAINLIQFAYVICVNVWLFNICQLSFELWFDFKPKKRPSGFCGLKSLGCLAWAWETCATSRWYWRSRLQHLGFPHASPCWRQLGQLYRTKRARNQRKKGSNWGILWCCCSCSVVNRRLLEQTTSKKNIKKLPLSKLNHLWLVPLSRWDCQWMDIP